MPASQGRVHVRVVVLGAGFGGLTFCQTFRFPGAEVTVVDRCNYHLFTPLLYQVATAGLSAPEIAQPIRSILSRHQHVTVLMDEAWRVDLVAMGLCLLHLQTRRPSHRLTHL